MRLTQMLGFAFCVVAALMFSNSSIRAENKIPDEYKTGGFFIGCQAYTFNHFSVFEAIEKTAEAGGRVIEFYPGQKLSREQPDVKWGSEQSRRSRWTRSTR